MPTNHDEWIKTRTIQLLQKPKDKVDISIIAPVQETPTVQPLETLHEPAGNIWTQAWNADSMYQEAIQFL